MNTYTPIDSLKHTAFKIISDFNIPISILRLYPQTITAKFTVSQRREIIEHLHITGGFHTLLNIEELFFITPRIHLKETN